MANIYKLTLHTLLDAARTTIAAVAALLLARLLKLPEFYWAPISAIVIIQSTIDPRTLAWQRFAGTALGAVLGALIATFSSGSALVYAAAIFLSGVLCAVLLERSALRGTPAARGLPFCGDYAEYCPIDCASAASMDRRLASLCGSFGGNRGGARFSRSVAWSRVILLESYAISIYAIHAPPTTKSSS